MPSNGPLCHNIHSLHLYEIGGHGKSMIPTIINLSTTSEYNNDDNCNNKHFANTSTTTVASGSLLHTTLLAIIMVIAAVVSSVMCVPVRSYSFVSSTGRRGRPLLSRSSQQQQQQQQREETSRGRLLVLGGTGF
jgi:hypothetical protein